MERCEGVSRDGKRGGGGEVQEGSVDGREFSSQDSVIFLMACGVNEEFSVGLWVNDSRPQNGAGVHFGAVGVDPGVGVPSRGPWRWDGGVLCGGQAATWGGQREGI